jgi:hypothetical protein
MANTMTGLFETHILPATAQLQAPLMLRNSMIKKIWVQPFPVPGRIAQTVSVNIPVVNEGDVIDIGNGPIQISDADHTNVTLVVNNNKSYAKAIRDFDVARSPYDFRVAYLDPAIEAVTRKINRSVCNLVTTTSFNVHASITGGADLFTRANIAQAWQRLNDLGVPMTPGAVHFVTGTVPYGNMIADTTNSWIQESVVGLTAAEAVQQRAMFAPQFQAQIDWDPMMPQPSVGATYAALFFNQNAIAIIPVAVDDAGEQGMVKTTYYQLPGSGLTYRIQYWYDPREQAWILHVHCVYALSVIRPNFGQYLVTT